MSLAVDAVRVYLDAREAGDERQLGLAREEYRAAPGVEFFGNQRAGDDIDI